MGLASGLMSIRLYRATTPRTAQRSNARLRLILTLGATACFLLVLVLDIARITLGGATP